MVGTVEIYSNIFPHPAGAHGVLPCIADTFFFSQVWKRVGKFAADMECGSLPVDSGGWHQREKIAAGFWAGWIL